MAQKEKEAPADDADQDAAEGEGAPKKGKKKLLMIVALVAVLGIGAAVAMLMGGGKKEEVKPKADAAAEAAAAKPVYYELPDFLVNLSSPSGKVSFLKMSVTLELRDKEAATVLKDNQPRVVDAFNTYLRELRPQDVQGSAGIYRLRDELMTRINGTIEEGLVKDILFSEIIVQ